MIPGASELPERPPTGYFIKKQTVSSPNPIFQLSPFKTGSHRNGKKVHTSPTTNPSNDSGGCAALWYQARPAALRAISRGGQQGAVWERMPKTSQAGTTARAGQRPTSSRPLEKTTTAFRFEEEEIERNDRLPTQANSLIKASQRGDK